MKTANEYPTYGNFKYAPYSQNNQHDVLDLSSLSARRILKQPKNIDYSIYFWTGQYLVFKRYRIRQLESVDCGTILHYCIPKCFFNPNSIRLCFFLIRFLCISCYEFLYKCRNNGAVVHISPFFQQSNRGAVMTRLRSSPKHFDDWFLAVITRLSVFLYLARSPCVCWISCPSCL